MTDILTELEKPGRDPRPEFRTATFAEGVHKIADLRPGMVLEGVVTNVAAFGAFVDVGVHQDGLVHVSAMSRQFVSDPRDVVKSGEVVRVKVLEVDEARKRISLTLRLDDEPGAAAKPERGEKARRRDRRRAAGPARDGQGRARRAAARQGRGGRAGRAGRPRAGRTGAAAASGQQRAGNNRWPTPCAGRRSTSMARARACAAPRFERRDGERRTDGRAARHVRSRAVDGVALAGRATAAGRARA